MTEPRTELHALLERVQQLKPDSPEAERRGVANDCLRMFEQIGPALLASRRRDAARAARARAKRDAEEMPAVNEPNPITYRMLHEEDAGMGLSDDFFEMSGIDPEAPVTCNCNWDEGHEPTCDIVAAHDLRQKRESCI